MAYDIQTTYNSFGGGISDDAFIWPVNSVADMDSIDVQTNDRYCTATFTYTLQEDFSLSWGATWFKSTPAWNFVSNTSSVTLNGSALSSVDGYTMNYYGTGSTQINYFFWSASIFKRNYDWSTSAGSITWTYAGWELGMVTGWHQLNLLYSKGNTIYYIDTNSDTINTAWSLMKWSVVKCIYAYTSDSIIIVATNWWDTYFYEATFSWSTYNIVPTLTEVWRTCIGAVGNKYDVFWIDSEWIHQYQGRQSQHIKYKTGLTQITYHKTLVLSDWNNIYRYWAKKPWKNSILTKIEKSSNLIDRDQVLDNVSGGFKIYEVWTSYKRTNTITLRPLDWWSYETPKHDLNYRFWLINPEWNAPTAEIEKCGIKIEVQTDEMEKDNNSFVTVYEEYIDSIWYVEVPPNLITTALTTANRKSEFWYATTRITLFAGDEIGSTDLYSKTPKLFDFTIYANYVKR